MEIQSKVNIVPKLAQEIQKSKNQIISKFQDWKRNTSQIFLLRMNFQRKTTNLNQQNSKSHMHLHFHAPEIYPVAYLQKAPLQALKEYTYKRESILY